MKFEKQHSRHNLNLVAMPSPHNGFLLGYTVSKFYKSKDLIDTDFNNPCRTSLRCCFQKISWWFDFNSFFKKLVDIIIRRFTVKNMI